MSRALRADGAKKNARLDRHDDGDVVPEAFGERGAFFFLDWPIRPFDLSPVHLYPKGVRAV